MRKRILGGKLVLTLVLLTGCAAPNPRVDRIDALGARNTALPPAPPLGELAKLIGPPSGLYADADPAARAPRDLDIANPATLASLDAAIALDSNNVQARIDRAYIWTLTGRRIEGLAEFARAQAIAPQGRAMQRRAYWSEGWAMYQLAEYTAAVRAWRRAEQLHGGAPSWVAPTYAVALWSAGDRDAALRWYDTAAKSAPSDWLTRDGLDTSIRFWREAEGRAMRELFAAFEQRSNEPAVPRPG